VSDARRFARAAQVNREPILAVLRRVLPAEGLVLEVASGTGEHAAFFAAALPRLTFQPSDVDGAQRASIAAWRDAAALSNVLAPLALDAAAAAWPIERADAVLCSNMIHIAPWAACAGLVAGAARILPPGGPLVLYGPFMRGGRHLSERNAAFDDGLQAQDPAWGVRDVDAVDALAAAAGLGLDEIVDMPSNNLTVIWRRGASRRSSAAPAGR
jgi:SAM-dependent methyltransferase